MPLRLPAHIVQSPAWRAFKASVGIRAILVNSIYIYIHRLPLININVGYCPKVIPDRIDWSDVIRAGKAEQLCMVKFDTPNIVKNSNLDYFKSVELFKHHCKKSSISRFSRRTIILDISKNTNTLLSDMHPKTRYNINYAKRKGIYVRKENNSKGLEILIALQKETARRQNFYVHPDNYYKNLWDTLYPKGHAHILVGYHNSMPLSAWLLFSYKNILYYPYGGSNYNFRNLMSSNLVAWEAIKLGKELNCELFDMWGCSDPRDKMDSWYGFTKFKLGYGGDVVEFSDTFDLVFNPAKYHLFNSLYNFNWKTLRAIKNASAFLNKMNRPI